MHASMVLLLDRLHLLELCLERCQIGSIKLRHSRDACLQLGGGSLQLCLQLFGDAAGLLCGRLLELGVIPLLPSLHLAQLREECLKFRWVSGIGRKD